MEVNAEQIEQFKTEITDALGLFKDEVKGEIALLKKAADLATTRTDLDNLRAQVDRIHAELLHAEAAKQTTPTYDSVSDLIWKSPAFADLKQACKENRYYRSIVSPEFSLSDPGAEMKTTITTSAVGRSTP